VAAECVFAIIRLYTDTFTLTFIYMPICPQLYDGLPGAVQHRQGAGLHDQAGAGGAVLRPEHPRSHGLLVPDHEGEAGDRRHVLGQARLLRLPCALPVHE
jgi:hypothetical protein